MKTGFRMPLGQTGGCGNFLMSAKHWSRPALLGGSQPQIDAATVMGYRRQAEKLFSGGDPADRKRLVGMWVQESS